MVGFSNFVGRNISSAYTFRLIAPNTTWHAIKGGALTKQRVVGFGFEGKWLKLPSSFGVRYYWKAAFEDEGGLSCFEDSRWFYAFLSDFLNLCDTVMKIIYYMFNNCIINYR